MAPENHQRHTDTTTDCSKQDISQRELLPYVGDPLNISDTLPTGILLKLIKAVMELSPGSSEEEEEDHEIREAQLPQTKRQRANTAGASRTMVGPGPHSLTAASSIIDPIHHLPLDIHSDDDVHSEFDGLNPNAKVTEVLGHFSLSLSLMC